MFYLRTKVVEVKSGQLKDLAEERIKEAEALVNKGLLHGAYYIGGYAVEFALKALVCKRLGIEVFANSGIPGSSDVLKALQTHNLSALLLFAGLNVDLKAKKKAESDAGNSEFLKAWSKASEWSEERRYQPLNCSKKTVIDFVKAVKLITEWILTYY